MNDKPSVIRETDEDARRQARILLRSARYAALAVIDPETGFPSASRVLVGTDIDGVPVILVSGLSAHTRALSADPRASLLAGEPGKGDPLAYPRLSVQCTAERVAHGPLHQRIRERFLGRHPKAALYIDFPDFCFFRLRPQSASLNGGFGRAYVLAGSDLEILSPANDAVAVESQAIIAALNADPAQTASTIGSKSAIKLKKGWRICGVDCAGFDIISNDILVRHELKRPITRFYEVQSYTSEVALRIPEI